MKVSLFTLPPAFLSYKTESFYSSCSSPAYITNRGRSMPGPFGSLWPIPVALKGHGAAHQRKMKVCTCYIGMFKIPHTETTIYDDDERPDCDEIMKNNQAARLALPDNLRPKYWEEDTENRSFFVKAEKKSISFLSYALIFIFYFYLSKDKVDFREAERAEQFSETQLANFNIFFK